MEVNRLSPEENRAKAGGRCVCAQTTKDTLCSIWKSQLAEMCPRPVLPPAGRGLCSPWVIKYTLRTSQYFHIHHQSPFGLIDYQALELAKKKKKAAANPSVTETGGPKMLHIQWIFTAVINKS